MFKSGDKVTYVTPYKQEHGIIKGNCNDANFVFVVYNCGGEWDNYMNYTGASTRRKDLIKGWINER